MENAETDCREVLARLSLYLDGEIAGGACAEIERHLNDCGPCLGNAEFARALKDLVRRRCGEPVPDGLRSRLQARIREVLE